nr:hypothetical protein [Tanacetum cinerariifolium]
MFEREKLSGNDFNDWFHQLKLVLRVEKKMYVIEQPLHAAPAADSEANVLAEWNAYNEVACLMLEEGKPVAAYVLQMKGYMDQLARLGYMLPQDLIVGLILNGLTKDFARFVRNYNMHNMGKTFGELHAMLIEYENGLPKKAETPQPKNPKPSAKEHPAKDDTCHHYKEMGHWKRNCPVYLAKFLKKKKQVGSAKHPAKDDTCHHYKEVGHWKRNCPVYLAKFLKKKKQVGSASSLSIFTIELFAFLINPGCMTLVVVLTFVLQNKGLEKQGN